MNVTDQEILELLDIHKKICVIGLSRDPLKPAQTVPVYLGNHGYEIVGVHPTESEIAGFKCYQRLGDVPMDFRKFVDVFRPPQEIPHIVDQVLEVGGVEVLFLQMGIFHDDAEARAEQAGIHVISNRCLYKEHERLLKSNSRDNKP